MTHSTLQKAIASAWRSRDAKFLSAFALPGLLAAVPLTSLAQDAAQDANSGSKLETIVVTGSRIRRVDLETASPVFVIDKSAIEKTGKLTIGDLLQESPVVSGAATNPQVNNGGGSGISTISLRGLGSNRTLILVNGHRLPNGSQIGVDVNQIPINLVERIEVLKDGASAIYGSDAIGGVVNFILRKDYQGLEASVNYGISDKDDGERKGGNMTLGHSSDRGSVMIGLDYNKQDEVLARDRKFAAHSVYLYSGEIIRTRGSSRTPTGRVFLNAADATAFGCGSVTRIAGAAGTSRADFRCYNPNTDSFNFQAVGNRELTPQERANAFVIGNYRITDHLEAYVEAFHNHTASNAAIAPLPFDARNDNVVISAQSIYNPFGYDFGGGQILSDGTQNLNFTLRLLALGPRRFTFSTNNDSFNGGLRGAFGDTSWTWDANFGYGHYANFFESFGYLSTPALNAATGPSFVDATGAHCGTPDAVIQGCLPVNIFNLADPSQVAALNSVRINPFTRAHYNLRTFEANATGELFDLPAGAMSLAVGASYRKEDYGFINDSITNLPADALVTGVVSCGTQQEACTGPTAGGFDVKEFYGELLIPVLKDMPFAKSLNLSVGARYSKYSNVGDTTNTKLSIEWRPIDDLLLRGTVAQVFRAPTVSDLFGAATGTAPIFTDPCTGITTAVGVNPAIDRACVNVPRDGTFHEDQGQVTGVVAGGQPFGIAVKPESGKTFTYGAVYDPSWLEGLSLSMDVYRIYINDTIVTLDVGTIATACVQAGQLCNFIHRNPDGKIRFIGQPTTNLGRLDTSGVDVGFKYRLPETPFGNFRVGLDATYIGRYDNDPLPGFGVLVDHAAGHFDKQFGNFARWRGLGTLAWSLGPWDAQWTSRYIHNFKLGSAVVGSTDSADGAIANVVIHRGATTYHNLQVGYNIEPINTRVELGVDNVFDKQPPLLFTNNVANGNTDERTFDTVGRYYFGRVSVKF